MLMFTSQGDNNQPICRAYNCNDCNAVEDLHFQSVTMREIQINTLLNLEHLRRIFYMETISEE